MAWCTVNPKLPAPLGRALATALLVAALAPAALGADASSPPANDLSALLAARIAPLLPDGARLDGITLGCKPSSSATLEQVAPGLTRLTSRGVVVVLRDGDRTMACSGTVAAERQVLAAARDFAAGEPVTAADLQPQWVDAFIGAPNALEQPPAAAMVAASAIRAGQPLYPWQLTRPLAFRPGDLVTVMITNGPVTLRALLEANSTASVGESATLINPETRTPVAVTATGPKTAALVMQ